MKSAGTTAPQCCELFFNYFTVLLTGSSSKLFAIRSIDDEKAKSIGHRMANMIVRADAQETGFAKTPISRISEASGVGEYELFLPLGSKKEKS